MVKTWQIRRCQGFEKPGTNVIAKHLCFLVHYVSKNDSFVLGQKFAM